MISPWLFEPATIAASMAIYRPEAIGDAPLGPERSGGWRREISCLARNGRQPRGRKSAAAVALRRSRRSRPSARSGQRGRGPRAEQLLGEDVANVKGTPARGWAFPGERKETLARRQKRLQAPPTAHTSTLTKGASVGRTTDGNRERSTNCCTTGRSGEPS